MQKRAEKNSFQTENFPWINTKMRQTMMKMQFVPKNQPQSQYKKQRQ